MATQTYNLHLTKPDATDAISPAAFNANFDIIDQQIADLNGYGAAVDGLSTTVGTLQTAVGDILDILDSINGEVV